LARGDNRVGSDSVILTVGDNRAVSDSAVLTIRVNRVGSDCAVLTVADNRAGSDRAVLTVGNNRAGNHSTVLIMGNVRAVSDFSDTSYVTLGPRFAGLFNQHSRRRQDVVWISSDSAGTGDMALRLLSAELYNQHSGVVWIQFRDKLTPVGWINMSELRGPNVKMERILLYHRRDCGPQFGDPVVGMQTFTWARNAISLAGPSIVRPREKANQL